MRLALTFALVLAATTASRQGCGKADAPPYDPCAGATCGQTCHACPPDAKDCGEVALAMACDPYGRCVELTDGMCASAGACDGKACGDDCTYEPPCRTATPPCMLPSVAGHCDASGWCIALATPPPGLCRPPPPPPVASCDGQACGVPCAIPCPAGTACAPATGYCAGSGCVATPPLCPAPPPPPSWGCAGKTCGYDCGYCPPGADPATCPVATFAPTACDPQLQCVTRGTFTCPPNPCAGQACGASCDPCWGMCMHPYASACDAAGACVPVPVTCAP